MSYKPRLLPNNDQPKFVVVYSEQYEALFDCSGNLIFDFGDKSISALYFDKCNCYQIHDYKTNTYTYADTSLVEYAVSKTDQFAYPERIGNPFDHHYITIVKSNGLYGVFDLKQKKLILPVQYTAISKEFLSNKVFYVTDQHKKNYFVDADNNKFGPEHVDHINTSTPYKNADCVILNTGDLLGLLNLNKKLSTPIKYDKLLGASRGGLTMAQMKGNNKYCFLTLEGKEITDFTFDRGFTELANDKIMFSKEGKRGVMNGNGKISIDAKYKDIQLLHDMYGVQSIADNKWALMDKDGFAYSDFIYDDLKADNQFILAKAGDKLQSFDSKGMLKNVDYAKTKAKQVWNDYISSLNVYNAMYAGFFTDWETIRNNKLITDFEKRRKFEKFLLQDKLSVISQSNNVTKLINQLLGEYKKQLHENDISSLNRNGAQLSIQKTQIQNITVNDFYKKFQ